MSKPSKYETFEKNLRANIEAIIDYGFGDDNDHNTWREGLACNMEEYHNAYISGAPMESIIEAITGYQVPEDVFLE